MLEVENVSKNFGGLAALKDVSFSFDGGILGIIGPNGAGKTTLFNVIMGVYRPTAGRVVFKGMDIAGKKPHQICRIGIGRTYQIPRPFGRETVMENLLVAGFFGRVGRPSKKELVEDAEEILEFVGLKEKAHVKASSLNLHQRKMLELARAMMTKPKILLLDEIVSGLTPSEIDQVILKIKEINERGIEILWIEHIMRAIRKTSERIIVLDHGEIISEGRPEEVANDPAVIKAYLGVEHA